MKFYYKFKPSQPVTYRNSETLLLNPLSQIPSDCKFVSNNYLYDINELAPSIYERNNFIRPYCNTPFTPKEVKKLLKFPAILRVLDRWEADLKNQKALDLKSKFPAETLDKIKDCGEILASDYTDDYLKSKDALENIGALLAKNVSAELCEQINHYFIIAYPFGSPSRQKFTFNANVCIHQKGTAIVMIIDDILTGQSTDNALKAISELRPSARSKNSFFRK